MPSYYANDGNRTYPMTPERFNDDGTVYNGYIWFRDEEAGAPLRHESVNQFVFLPRDWRNRWHDKSDIPTGLLYTTDEEFPPGKIDDELAAAGTFRGEAWKKSPDVNPGIVKDTTEEDRAAQGATTQPLNRPPQPVRPPTREERKAEKRREREG
jgi:hypothetical protein